MKAPGTIAPIIAWLIAVIAGPLMAFFNINVFGEWARFGIFPGEMTVPVLLLFLSSMWFAYRKHLLGTDEDVVGWFIVLFFSGWAISFMLQFGGCILVSVPW